jgi:hypothetical protein
MPINKVDYNTNNTVIYKIQCVDVLCDFVYFGSTTNFASRKSQHKSACYNENNKSYNLNLYKTIRANKGWENFEVCLVEVFACETKQQLLIREQFHIDSHRNNMNMYRAHRTIEDTKEINKKNRKQYYTDNKECILEQRKQYTIDNKEKIAEQKKRYYQDHKK